MNSVDLCNMALNQIGNKRIMSLDSEMEEAKQCKQYYDICRQDLLRQIEWTFAKRVSPLTLTTTQLQGWKYAYDMPRDCLFIRYIYSENMRPLYKNKLEYYDVYSESEASAVIGSNIEGAFLEYTYDLKNVDMFPPDFRRALVYYLASELAVPLSASSDSRQECYSLYQVHLDKAAKANGNENREKLPFTSDIMRARNGDWWGDHFA